MVSIGTRRAARAAARLAAMALAIVLVAACAAPGAVSTADAAAPSAPAAAPSRRSAARNRRPAPRRRPTAGRIRSSLNAYFETGFDLPFKLSEEFTKQFPNVTWDIKQDQFTNLMTATPRLLSGDNPPDLIRLPSMVSLVKDGLLKNLDDYATAFGWDQWPPAQLAQNRVAEDGTRGSGSLYAMGLNYSLTGVFYNKELAAQIGMTEPPTTVAEFEDLLAKAKDAGLLPIMQWNATASGGGLAFPLQNLMAAYGPTEPINDWIFQKAGRDDRHADQPDRRRAPPAVGRSRVLSRRTSTPSSTPTPTRASARAKACSCSTATGRTRPTTRTCRATSASSSSRPAEAGGTVAAMSAPLTYGIATNAEERRLRRVLLQLGRDQRDGPPDRRRRRWLQPGRSDRPAGPAGGGRLGDQRDAGRRRRRRHRTMARWTSSPTRPARSSPRAGHPSSRRWSAAGRMPPAC